MGEERLWRGDAGQRDDHVPGGVDQGVQEFIMLLTTVSHLKLRNYLAMWLKLEKVTLKLPNLAQDNP